MDSNKEIKIDFIDSSKSSFENGEESLLDISKKKEKNQKADISAGEEQFAIKSLPPITRKHNTERSREDWLKHYCRQYNLRFNLEKENEVKMVDWLDNHLEEYGVLDELSRITGRTYESGLNTKPNSKGEITFKYNSGKQAYIKQLIYEDMKRRGFID